MTALPDGLTIEKNARLFTLPNLKSLPSSFHVKYSLTIRHAFNLESLGDNLTVGGHLNIDDCPQLTELPAYLASWGRLDLPDARGAHDRAG